MSKYGNLAQRELFHSLQIINEFTHILQKPKQSALSDKTLKHHCCSFFNIAKKPLTLPPPFQTFGRKNYSTFFDRVCQISVNVCCDKIRRSFVETMSNIA